MTFSEMKRLCRGQWVLIEMVDHDLPFAGPIDGLLGMDILLLLRARIDTAMASLELV